MEVCRCRLILASIKDMVIMVVVEETVPTSILEERLVLQQTILIIVNTIHTLHSTHMKMYAQWDVFIPDIIGDRLKCPE